jgi:hypothetical protein
LLLVEEVEVALRQVAVVEVVYFQVPFLLLKLIT